ncbi:MAG: hypothetical protein GYB66_14830, partial [Chloroflexi bacterium]|nr:hypothetical protein [Chloroflexota bacterium]
MTMPLDRETRKSLVRLAETDTEYSQSARIVLALASGQSAQQIAIAVRVPVNEVLKIQQHFEAEGISIFGDALVSDQAEQADPNGTQLAPSGIDEAVAKAEADDEDDEPREMGDDRPAQSRSSRRRTRHRNKEARDADQSSDRQADHGFGEDDKNFANSQFSVDDAVAEGLEALLDEVDSEDLAAAMSPRKVVIESDVSRARPQSEEIAEPVVIEEIQERPDPEQPISIGALAAAFDVDMAHARYISVLARQLFDATANVHRLSAHYRDLLHAAALLHRIAYHLDPGHYHVLGRDLILEYTLKDVTSDERQIIAVMTAAQRETALVHQEPSYTALPDADKSVAETLAGLFRMAVGLDASQTQSVEVLEWFQAPGEIVVVLDGDDVTTDIQQAQQRSDLWNHCYADARIRFVVAGERAPDTERFAEAPPRWPELAPLDLAVEVSNKLRRHYAARLSYLVDRVRHHDNGVLVALSREFNRLVGIWEWLVPGSKPRRVFAEDTAWLAELIQQALLQEALADRSGALLSETDPNHDDPQAVHDLNVMSDFYQQMASQAFSSLRQALESRRFSRWIDSVQAEVQPDPQDTLTFSSQIAERAWAYLGELRQVMDRINLAGWNADLSVLLTIETMETFLEDLRLLIDLLTFSGSLLGTEHEQVLDVLEPLMNYLLAWQRMEYVAQIADQN